MHPARAGATLSVVNPPALLVYVPQGRVWITEENEAADFILDHGGWHRLDRPGHAVVETFTPAEWAAAAGSFGHVYADGPADRTVVVSATDEDGTWVLGSQSLTVENVAPELVISGAASTLEGSTYVLSVAGSDAAGPADPLVYEMNRIPHHRQTAEAGACRCTRARTLLRVLRRRR